MSILYAPWRSDYVTKKNKPSVDGCLFCGIIALNDDHEQFIVKRYEHCVLMLNRFPYANGHLLIVPFKHGSFLSEFEPAVLNNIMEVTALASITLKSLMNPHGFNIGCNLGATAGAGIPEHLHQHLIPRWGADVGFLELIGKTTTINIDLREFYNNLTKTLK